MKAFFDGTRCVQKASGIGVTGIDLPAELWDVPCHELVLVDGAVMRQPAAAPVVDLTAAALVRLRADRDRRLAGSDIMVMADRWDGYTAAQRSAWAAYRQALRDLPETITDPEAPVWPVEPDTKQGAQ